MKIVSLEVLNERFPHLLGAFTNPPTTRTNTCCEIALDQATYDTSITCLALRDSDSVLPQTGLKFCIPGCFVCRKITKLTN